MPTPPLRTESGTHLETQTPLTTKPPSGSGRVRKLNRDFYYMNWNDASTIEPPLSPNYREKRYLLAIDEKNRMSVGYCVRQPSGFLNWTFAKPITRPTHWMLLPEPPKR